MAVTRGQHCKATVDALVAFTTMSMQSCHFPYMGTTNRIFNEVGESVLTQNFHHLCPSLPEEGIFHLEGLPHYQADQFSKTLKGLRVGGPRGPCSDQLGRDRQV